ncbi:MAG: ABC transporter ATP-binding protein [Candidatus Omnitrophica bacterium]|nr:ABC transporter ATP-binding protein [Candidatus Omnitrophota bacterium]MBU4468477.1 ABC transporter ATP-binding protein [Candidatus Omnitrophota bacterium]MCG2707504.1 ABC transporter ATP-binding protein [Candidatus Omnitrophota bacterium]
MTTFPAKISEKDNPAELAKALELVSVGKKYTLQGGQISKKAVGEDFWALKDVSLNVFPGKILGVLGRNGAGKTTLLNIISGVFAPTEGKIIARGRVLGLFNLGVGFQDEFTGRENIFLNGAVLGASRKELNDQLNKIIEFSELDTFIDMPLGTYSQGMRLRLAFSIIANLDFDTLVMDEVLAVGDALFQSKCFERLMDFKRAGKTLVITTQSMDLIERLCDKAALLDHGHLLFYGDTPAGINKYRALLNTEKFFVGLVKKNMDLVENTKKWVDDVTEWGKKLGTKEVIIESVEFINKWGLKCEKIKSREQLKIKVRFRAKNRVKEPHFGVAIFREDGVYCYGPNTAFDGHTIPELKPGRGYFILDCHKLLLAPGEYRISVAVWDKNETLAYDYHAGFYKLIVTGYHSCPNYD